MSLFTCLCLTDNLGLCSIDCHIQVIPSHGNPQIRWTLSDGYLFKYCSVKYQTFYQVSETSQQTYSHQKTTRKAFQMHRRAIKHQLTCPIELTSGSILIGRRGILVIPRNRLDPRDDSKLFCKVYRELAKSLQVVFSMTGNPP